MLSRCRAIVLTRVLLLLSIQQDSSSPSEITMLQVLPEVCLPDAHVYCLLMHAQQFTWQSEPFVERLIVES